ncbi:MAG TPA: LPP20 family lipoprotein [Burkholderiales bacterium]|nr:LPP20 family lipoprotein [Burkholderiales bacterium]
MKIPGSQFASSRTLAAAALALALAACGGGKTVVESDLGIKGAPDWVNKGTQAVNDKDGRLFHGVGSSPSLGDEALQRSTADDRARAEVARMLSTYLDVVSSDYAASSGTGSSTSADQSVSRQIKAVTKQNLAGSKIIGRWKDPKTSTVYSIAELDLKQIKTTLEGANGMNDDLRRYVGRNADNIFDKVSGEKSK